MATGTRTAKLMEEQVGTLLATLQEQGQRQEQLARDQANHFSRQLEQLAQEQRERHAAFSEQFTEQLAQEQRQRHAEFSQQFSEQLERLSREPTCYRVITSSDITIPASSEVIIPGKLDKPAHSTTWGILESNTTSNLLVGKALVDLQRQGVPVRVLNLSDQPRRFKKGCNLATCTPLTSVCSATKSASDDLAHDIEVPL